MSAAVGGGARDFRLSPLSYVAYNAIADRGGAKAASEAAQARLAMLADPKIAALVKELQSWPGPHINSHKSAGQFFHKLVFLADIGLKHDDPGMEGIVSAVLDSMDENGVPCLSMEISSARGGQGAELKAWALCDAPSIVYALKKLGVEDARLRQAAAYLARLPHCGGYGCSVSPALGSWRGPGKKSDPCPFATLGMLKMLLLFGEAYTREVEDCAECLLDLWENSRTKHPYIFYAGTDFRKLKLPFVWYDILHVADVLSRVASRAGDRRLLEMFALIKSKEGAGGYTPEALYQAWKDWDFGQKKQPSDWMTYRIEKIEARLPPAAG